MPTTTLGKFLTRTESGVHRVAKLTGIPKQTISNWLDGHIIKLLYLTAGETDELLTAACHPRLAQLRAKATQTADRALFTPWPLPVTAAPFQGIHDLVNFVG